MRLQFCLLMEQCTGRRTGGIHTSDVGGSGLCEVFSFLAVQFVVVSVRCRCARKTTFLGFVPSRAKMIRGPLGGSLKRSRIDGSRAGALGWWTWTSSLGCADLHTDPRRCLSDSHLHPFHVCSRIRRADILDI